LREEIFCSFLIVTETYRLKEGGKKKILIFKDCDRDDEDLMTMFGEEEYSCCRAREKTPHQLRTR
jgi:hypothetical protein